MFEYVDMLNISVAYVFLRLIKPFVDLSLEKKIHYHLFVFRGTLALTGKSVPPCSRILSCDPKMGTSTSQP